MAPANIGKVLGSALQNLFLVNVAVNVAGIWQSYRYWKLKRAARRLEVAASLAEGADPLDVIHSQALVIDVLSSKCNDLQQLSDQQRKLMMKEAVAGACACQEPSDQGHRSSSSSSLSSCPICCSRSQDCAFDCGHVACFRCGVLLDQCHICRKDIQSRVKLYL